MSAAYQVLIGLIRPLFSSRVVLRHEFGFYKPVEFTQQDIGKYRTQNGALWNSTERFVERPIVHVSCVQELFHEIEEPSVLGVFGECRNDEIMIEASKAIGYVALDDPSCARPGAVDFSEGRVAFPIRAEAVRVVTECSIKVRIQDHSHHFCQELVAPNRHTKRPLFPVFLWDIRSSCWLPLIPFLP